jgi:hypothetical protein
VQPIAPDCKCVPDGALAGLIVPKAPVASAATAPIIRARTTFRLKAPRFLCIPLSLSLLGCLEPVEWAPIRVEWRRFRHLQASVDLEHAASGPLPWRNRSAGSEAGAKSHLPQDMPPLRRLRHSFGEPQKVDSLVNRVCAKAQGEKRADSGTFHRDSAGAFARDERRTSRGNVQRECQWEVTLVTTTNAAMATSM